MIAPAHERAPAKINLALHVRRRRPDGYHDIETLFAFCRHGDEIEAERAEADTLEITGPYADALRSSPERGGGPPAKPVVEGLPRPAASTEEPPPPAAFPPPVPGGTSTPAPENLVIRAAAAFRNAFALGPLAITLTKNLPVASGIGGGSADAAATLRACARLAGIDPADPRLHEIAASLGADVPACLLGRTAFATGRGDVLRPLDALGDRPALLVNPGVAVSTGAVFAAWDGVDRGGIAAGDPLAAAAAGRNDLEPPARAIAPPIDTALAWLAARPGAGLVRMSGSGATCFALFDDPPTRDAAARAVPPDWWHLATTLA